LSSCTSLNFVFKSHFITSSITLSSLPNFFPWRASLRAQNNWKSEGIRSGQYGGWGKTVHLSFMIASCVFKLLCDHALLCWSRSSAKLLWSQTLLKCFRKVLRLWMYRSGLMVWTHMA
jgi:hypothetical protein